MAESGAGCGRYRLEALLRSLLGNSCPWFSKQSLTFAIRRRLSMDTFDGATASHRSSIPDLVFRLSALSLPAFLSLLSFPLSPPSPLFLTVTLPRFPGRAQRGSADRRLHKRWPHWPQSRMPTLIYPLQVGAWRTVCVSCLRNLERQHRAPMTLPPDSTDKHRQRRH